MAANYLNSEPFKPLNHLESYLLRQSIFLSRQELKVLYWATQGKNNPEIAAQLGTATCTVKTHKNNLIAKLGVAGKAGFQKFLLEIAQNIWLT